MKIIVAAFLENAYTLCMPKQLPVSRQKTRKSFRYFADGQPLTNKQEIDYIKSLRIPPAWRDVQITLNRNAKIQATGLDKVGRKQYIYNAAYRARQERAKYERILRFAKALPEMRRITARHLSRKKFDREKVLACIVLLMDQAYLRVGNDTYARENNSYGLTTMRSKHTSVKGDTITFDFTGKSGQKHVKQISDRALARIVKRLDELPGHEVFKYYDEQGRLKDVKSVDVNAYIKEVMGEEFSAKDFRTWGGTVLATAELLTAEQADSERERKKAVTSCVKKVAKKLGNTPAVARSSYIDPRVIQSFVDNHNVNQMRQAVSKLKQSPYFSPNEYCVLRLLKNMA